MIAFREIWIEAECWAVGEWKPLDVATDVIVTMNNGQKFVATFITYQYLQTLVSKNERTGECLNGKYFWASDMILVDKCTRFNIERIVKHLLQEDEFVDIFDEIKTETSLNEK